MTPMLISKRTRLNTTVAFLSAAFFAWVWSVLGMVVALPILIVIKIISDETPSLSTLERFLGDIDVSAARDAEHSIAMSVHSVEAMTPSQREKRKWTIPNTHRFEPMS